MQLRRIVLSFVLSLVLATGFVAIRGVAAEGTTASRPQPARASRDEAPTRRWPKTQVVDAPEAFQAAAADQQHLYAISSVAVSRYHRSTLERIGVSHGPAEHLNSGYFWEGLLYCAHSNYPRKPEQSEIKRLDPRTMELSTWHNFGDSEGSLTWCIRQQGNWYCNFAWYGEENHRTALIRFDDEWNETGRWTYPPQVIAALGRYSLSGGVFQNGELFVTGHDEPVLFRLRIPETGSVLEFVGRDAVPFTGQGIAVDPVTGGLVGIDRVRRQIVLTSPVVELP